MDKQKNRISPPALGGVSLLVVFAVLCLTVFALLSLSTVQADARLADASVQAVADYYAADCAAQEILARLRAGEKLDVTEGPDGVYSYSCPLSETQTLLVEVRLDGGSYTILRWQTDYIGQWEADDSLTLWDGSQF